MKKGFHPSRTGKNENAVIGRGSESGNRRQRRSELALQKGEHRNKSGILKVVGNVKFISRLQIIEDSLVWDKNKNTYRPVKGRKILHWVAKG